MSVKWFKHCEMAPDDAPTHEHECMAGELRCVYCGNEIEAYPCHGCGQFMTAADMHNDDRGLGRCEACK